VRFHVVSAGNRTEKGDQRSIRGEDAPAEMLTRRARVASGLAGQLLAHLRRQLVVRVGVEPAAQVEPLGRDVPIPAVLVGQHHLHDVVPEALELTDQVRQWDEVGDGGGVAVPRGVLVRRDQPPVGLVDQQHAARAQAAAKQLGRSGDAVADPRGADARRQIDGLVRHVAGGVTVHELDAVVDTELERAGTCLLGEGRADVDTRSWPPSTGCGSGDCSRGS
jgi:hypothetical protein